MVLHQTDGRRRIRDTPDARIAAVCVRQHGVIAWWQLGDAGLTRRAVRARVDARRLHVVLAGVYAPSPVLTDDGRRAAAILASARSDAVRAVRLGVWSAAELLGVAAADPAAHHTVLAREGRRRSQPGLVIHRLRRLDERDTTTVRSLRVTAAGRTLLDCAASGLRGRALERAVAEAEYLGLLDARSLDAILQRNRGHPGLGLLGAVDLAQVARERTESPLEEEVHERLRLLDIPSFACQVWVRGLSGTRYRADFVWEEHRLLLEADGRGAHARARTLDEDRARDNDLTAVGWTTMRVTRRQVRTAWVRFARQLVTTLAGCRPRGV